MQFKIFLAVALFASSSMSQSTDFNGALATLTEIRENISVAQTDYWNQLTSLRSELGGIFGSFFSDMSDIIKERVETIAASDADIRVTLAAFTNQQLSCVVDATRFVDQTIQYSGYAISSCIETTFNASQEVDSFRDLSLFDTVERNINNLPSTIINSLINHNIYTQFAEVELLATETFATRVASIEADLEALRSTVAAPQSWETLIGNLNSCFDSTQQAVNDGLAFIASRAIPSCRQFAK